MARQMSPWNVRQYIGSSYRKQPIRSVKKPERIGGGGIASVTETTCTMTRIVPLALAAAMAVQGAGNNVTQGLNSFSTSLYERVAKGSTGNVVLSPFNVGTALAMALVGARGETAAEMAKVLGQSSVDASYHKELMETLDRIADAANSGGNKLSSANRLWIQQDFKKLAEFRDTLQNVYRAPAAPVDFARALDRSRAEINSWTAEQIGRAHV